MTRLLIIVLFSSIACIWACSDSSGRGSCAFWTKNVRRFCQGWGKIKCERTCGFCTKTTSPPVRTLTPYPTPIPGSCGVSKVQQGRVVNGVNSQPGAWPWIASLQRSKSHWCGATLISPKWVLTASHCVQSIGSANLNTWTIKLGAHDHRKTESSVQRINIKRVIVHPQFGKGKDGVLSNDVTLIELVRPATLNDRVALGCLPNKGVYPTTGKQCYIAGWGSISHPGGVYHTLQQAKLPVVEREHRGCHYKEDVVCVGLGFDKQSDNKQHPNACRGDSGGPLVCQQSDDRWQLEGVASFVYTYCKYYTAYAPVNKYIDWINSYIQQ